MIYSYIPPGSYQFQVTACNSDGIWNPTGAAMAFMIRPYFWQTWWFRIMPGVSAAALLTGGVLWITRRRMRRKFERLERQRAIERERTRIARDIHDNLGANLTRISLLSQSAQGELQNPGQAAVQLNRIYYTSRELTRSIAKSSGPSIRKHDTLDSLGSYLGNLPSTSWVFLPFAAGWMCRATSTWPVTAEVRHNLFPRVQEALHMSSNTPPLRK